MNTKWTSNAIPGSETNVLSTGEQERFVVLLLYGKNSFGDKIYSYLKITLPDLPKLKTAIQSGNGFNPSDFGTVVAAGKGEPPPEVKAEIAATYNLLAQARPAGVSPEFASDQKKNWDEY